MTSLFSQEELKQLEMSVIWMFLAIAGADKRIDAEEINALNYIKNNSNKIPNELLKKVIDNCEFHLEEINEWLKVSENDIRKKLRDIANILDEKLDKFNSLMFKKSLLALGMFVAFSSGDLLSSKMSNLENQVLVELSLFMKISNKEYREEPTIYTLMNNFKK